MKIGKQIFSILVSVCLVTGMLPAVSLAAESNDTTIGIGGLCEHHTAHDEICGYVEASAENPCAHEHGAECYTEVISCNHIHTEDCYPVWDDSVSGNGTTDPDAGAIGETMPSEDVEPTECDHACSVESGCIVQELGCAHEHDEICGYVPEVEGHPCTYVCELCALTEITAWNWVDVLEVLDPASGILALSGAGAENTVLYDEIVDMLPTEITADTENGTETVTLDGWSCDNYPEAGAYTGSYRFTAALPDGYALAENVPALTVTVEFGGVAVLDGTEHSHPICGATHTDIGDHTGTCEAVAWEAWDGTSEITYDSNNTAYVYLADNVERTATFKVEATYTLYLCLNGHSITNSSSGTVIQVNGNAQFILCNCQSSGTITHSANVLGKGVKVGSGYNAGDAAFTMYGGTISGNHVGTSDKKEDGAGVEISRGTFTMYGGTISDNHVDAASNYGGGGVLGGKFIMYGGTISNNTSDKSGGGVMVWGSGSSKLYGGTISGNTAIGDGGGICTNVPLTISGSTVIKNNNGAKGGGVYFYSTYGSDILTISDSVEISDNSATNGGGICIVDGCLTINGGSITGNTATENGGGVYFDGITFKISGGVSINGNKKGSADNNVYLPKNRYITIVDKLTGGKIGVTTEITPDSTSYVQITQWSSKDDVDPEKFQYENNETPISVVVSSSGSTARLIVCEHNWSTDWSTDSSNHWHSCAICRGQNDTAAHIYDQEIAMEGYRKSEATCISGTIYYKSCICGNKGTETFESGDKNPDRHSGTLGDEWKSDGSNHWKEYTCCGISAETAAHTPGPAATEEAPQTCTECGYELAPALEHTHVWGAWISNGDGTHTRTCEKNSSHTERNSCSGGTATCQSPAVCDICAGLYGDKDMSNHTGGTEVRDSVEATTDADGYTGDTYCLGCNTKIKDGTVIPKKNNGGSNSGNNSGSSSGSGNGSNTVGSNGSGDSIPVTRVTVSVSGDEKTIRVDVAVSGTTATIEHVDLSILNTVIGDDVKTGVVTIDFSVLEKEVDTVKLPANVVKQIAEAVNDPDNDAESLEIVLTDGTSIEFDAEALDAKIAQMNGTDLAISITRTTDNSLNNEQQQAVDGRPAWKITVTSGGRNISDMGGEITVHVPYELLPGEQAEGIVVYYVDENGNRTSCETGYDPVEKRVSWKTDHLSVYMIGYDESRVSPGMVTYIVQKGDNLWMIAKKHGSTVSAIVAANSDLIKNPNLIYARWELQIPQ